MWTTAINMKILNVMQVCDSNFPVGSFNPLLVWKHI